MECCPLQVIQFIANMKSYTLRPPKTKDISSKHVILEPASISLHSILKITFLLAKPDGRAARPDQLIMLQDIEF